MTLFSQRSLMVQSVKKTLNLSPTQITMSEETLKCEYDNCQWISAKGCLSDIIKLYEFHMKVKHSSVQNVSKPEKAKRPELLADTSDEDWVYFKARWEEYKKATGLSGDDLIIQLME